MYITGIGMISSVGWSAQVAAAAFRGGLSRPREFLEYSVYSDEYGESALSGYPVYPLTEGFIAAGRWGRLLERCFEDLVLGGNLPDAGEDAFWGRTGLVVCLPYLHDDRFGWCEPGEVELMGDSLLSTLSLPGFGAVHVKALGHAGVAAATELGRSLIAEGELDRCIVLGVDSYLDDVSVHWLLEEERLKQHSPCGLMPDACRCLVDYK